YGVYSSHDPVTGPVPPQITAGPFINYRGIVAPAATDIQITGAASTGSPSVGSTFTYTYQIKDGGSWGTFGSIIFVDTLLAALTYVSSSVVQGTTDPFTAAPTTFTNPNGCSAVGQTVVCSLHDMTIS